MVKVLTAPNVKAIPLTLKYAAQPAINKADAPIIRVNKFITYIFHIRSGEKTRTYSQEQKLFTRKRFPFPSFLSKSL
ncbi:MAG: hypothetical protein CBC16_10435 [Verrucomicrobia bacterium TMED56]|nr:MAG: hypothetical protein CBC16_10435 [Verrucomicrobia bacterium TMED56]